VIDRCALHPTLTHLNLRGNAQIWEESTTVMLFIQTLLGSPSLHTVILPLPTDGSLLDLSPVCPKARKGKKKGSRKVVSIYRISNPSSVDLDLDLGEELVDEDGANNSETAMDQLPSFSEGISENKLTDKQCIETAPTTGGSSTTTEGAAPTTGGSAPTTGGSSPTTEGCDPVAGGSAPVAGGSAPSVGGSAPVAGGSASSVGGSAPVAGSSPPSVGGSAPVAGGSAPSVGGSTPIASGSAPGAGGSAPVGGGSTPGACGSAPGVGGSAPVACGSALGVGGSAPGPCGTAPGAGCSAPVAGCSGLRAASSAPATRDSIHKISSHPKASTVNFSSSKKSTTVGCCSSAAAATTENVSVDNIRTISVDCLLEEMNQTLANYCARINRLQLTIEFN